MTTTISSITQTNLCIGCGLCASVCPTRAIRMHWASDQIWTPELSKADCTRCGICYDTCPQTPELLAQYSACTAESGDHYGLPINSSYYISYDRNNTNRLKSASGGTLTILLSRLLTSGRINGVLTAVSLSATQGSPHSSIEIIRTSVDLEKTRSSHYHPLTYDQALTALEQSDGLFAVVALPCVARGLKRLPSSLTSKICFVFSPVCSHSVKGSFMDCLARQQGISIDEAYHVNLRDKVNIPDALSYNIFLKTDTLEIRRNRFATAHTDMWRNYYFTPECCFYCPDFLGSDADLSVKDAWGPLSKDPLGTSLLTVRNFEIADILETLQKEKQIHLEPCDSEEIFDSQPKTFKFKHISIRDRLVWKKSIQTELKNKNYLLGTNRRLFNKNSIEYFRLLTLSKVSTFFYSHYKIVPVKSLIFCSNLHNHIFVFAQQTIKTSMKIFKKYIYPAFKMPARFFGILPPVSSSADSDSLKVLIAGGYGYGNIGDEAQLAANLEHWKKAAPNCLLTILTPDIAYTEKTHPNIRTELASRTAFLGLGMKSYFGSEKLFKKLFFPVALLLCLNALLMRSGIPVFGCTARQAHLLNIIQQSDLLFLSGGGYLTGDATLSRLWDNMLLIRIADIFNVPTILSGQTIGLIKHPLNHRIAKWGLSRAKLIYLRDPVDSKNALASIGITDNRVACTFDDALCYQIKSESQVKSSLKESGIDPDQPYMAVNVHYWGQKKETSRNVMNQVSICLDNIVDSLGMQIAFIPMHYSDEEAINEVIGQMKQSAIMIKHNYCIDLAIGAVRHAALCLTMKHHPIIFAMGGGVPTVAIALDEYYNHKNKGAMQLFGQSDYVICENHDQIAAATIKKTKKAYLLRRDISHEINRKYAELKSRAGEVIWRYTDQLDTKPS